MIPWLNPQQPPNFPPTQTALSEPNGLLAAGGSLTPDWLLTAYKQGIFPWFSEGEPILWWSPAPRTVFFPESIHISRSLKKKMRQLDYQVRQNTDFKTVIERCAEPRQYQEGTWITQEMQQAYLNLHELGFAHSWEFYINGELLGGLYGVAIGQVFFGESMFSRFDNASKITLVHLAQSNQYRLIDCQLPTDHVKSLGASSLAREEFETLLRRYCRD